MLKRIRLDLAPIGDQRGQLEKCIDAQLGTALTSDRDVNEDTRIWPAAAGCTVNCMHALDKFFLKSQPLVDRRRAVFHCALQTDSRPEDVPAHHRKG